MIVGSENEIDIEEWKPELSDLLTNHQKDAKNSEENFIEGKKEPP